MQPDPRHPVDPWLEAYARQRANHPGLPREMTPATRERLQAEVASHHRSVADTRPPATSWRLVWWPRLVWGGVALAGLVILGLVTIPRDFRVSSPQPVAKRAADLSAASATRSPAVSSPAPERKQLALAKPPRGSITAFKDQPSVIPLEAAAPSPPRENRRLSATQWTFQSARSGMDAEVLTVTESRARQENSAVPAPAASRLRTVSSPDAKAKAGAARPSPFLVLRRFDWDQQADRLRLIDEDGSIYSGQILPPPATAGVINFSASGTNLTLRQTVDIRGQVITDTNRSTARKIGESQSGRGGGAQVAMDRAPWPEKSPAQSVRLAGQALLNGTNRFFLQATNIHR